MTQGCVTRVASYALLVDQGRILLCRISAQCDNAGQWTLPGGGLEFGEHPADTCHREVREETGLEIQLEGIANVDSETIKVGDKQVHAIRFVYWATAVGGHLTAETDGSTDDCRWYTQAELRGIELVALAERSVRIAFASTSRFA
jgi:ADP-ribose pyrophosphatase YjhB (NUDIX family)